CRRGFFFQAENGIRGRNVSAVQTCALPISCSRSAAAGFAAGAFFGSAFGFGFAAAFFSGTAFFFGASTITICRPSSLGNCSTTQIGRASCRERVRAWVLEVGLLDEKGNVLR